MQRPLLTEVVVLTKTYNLQDFKDWLHWHIDILGFQHAHVFDNESLVNIKSVCDAYGNKVSYEKVNGFPNQYALYNRYIMEHAQAWWVLPIDDDEFLYVGSSFDHNVNTMIMKMQERFPKADKIAIGWRNMFPAEFKEKRTCSLIENATAWSDEACERLRSEWRQDNRWLKTFTRLTKKWHWGQPYNGGHNPTAGVLKSAAISIAGIECKEDFSTKYIHADELFIAHFQYKSDEEWRMKCSKRKSAAHKTFNKNKPAVYCKLYDYQNKFNIFNEMVELWHGKSIV